MKRSFFSLAALALFFFTLPQHIQAAIPALVQGAPTCATCNRTNGAFVPTVQASYGNPVTAGNLLVAVVSAWGGPTLVAPSNGGTTSWQIAINENISETQAIFYKIASATDSQTVTASTGGGGALMALQLFEFSGIDPAQPFDNVKNSSLDTANAPTISTGSVMPTSAPSLLIAAFSKKAAEGPPPSFGSFSNGFTKQTSMLYGDILRGWGADAVGYLTPSNLGTYSTSTSPNGNNDAVRAQIVAFRAVNPTAADSTISGKIRTSNGAPLAGTTVTLSGTQTRRTITDNQGNYHFDNIESSGFYTITPSRVNYSFSPPERSFSIVGNRTDAGFTADASTETANPIDTDLYFVRQHYLDFLNREPDTGGLDYWASRLDDCRGDSSCIHQRRIDVSAAYFMSEEFQATGSFVYRLYEGALGRQISYSEFSQDRQAMSNMDGSKASLADAFVQRPEFMRKYSSATTAESFVDLLIQSIRQTSGADLTSQRSTLINKYNAGGNLNQSRSLALIEAIEADSFKVAEYNNSFVLMQYFGYLRRDPDAGGYNFWLGILSKRLPGSYRAMVCAFLTSTEYQRRFSSVITRSNGECGQ